MGNSYEEILNNMLSRVNSSLDKREGSIIYDALAPSAYALSLFYKALDSRFNQGVVSTATGEALSNLVADYGIYRKPATKSRRLLELVGDCKIEIGDEFITNDGEMTFKVVANNEGNIIVEPEKAGAIGNDYVGNVLPINMKTGFVSGKITSIIFYGEDEETDEALRERYRIEVIKKPSQGNLNQYLSWAKGYKGVLNAVVEPHTNGEINIYLIGNNGRTGSSELISDFQNYIDPKSEGLGMGVAPIGAKVFVKGAVEKKINIQADIQLNEGFSSIEPVKTELISYFRSIAGNERSINYIKIGAIINDLPLVKSVKNLKVNNLVSDQTLALNEIPVEGIFTFNVIS